MIPWAVRVFVCDRAVCDKYAFMCDYSRGLFYYTRQAKKSHPVDQ